MNNFIKTLIYKSFPSWLYYEIAYYVKKRRLKLLNKILCNKNSSVIIFDLLKKRKNNEKVFIFGSGSSINELSQKNYKEINDNCSIGVNNWIFHNFITNYYMIELGHDYVWNEKIRLRILSLLKNQSKNPIFLVYISYFKGSFYSKKMKNWMRGMDPKKVFLYEYLRPDIFKNDLEKEFLKTLKSIAKNKKSNVLTLGIRASLERTISLSLLLRYSKIILLGIDLKNTKVFWSDKDSNFKGIVSGQKAKGFHETALPKFGGMTVQKSILILNQVAKQYCNSQIYISTNKSLLSTKLKKYKWQDK